MTHCAKHPTVKLFCPACSGEKGGTATNRSMTSPERKAAMMRVSHARPAWIAKQKRLRDAMETLLRKQAAKS